MTSSADFEPKRDVDRIEASWSVAGVGELLPTVDLASAGPLPDLPESDSRPTPLWEDPGAGRSPQDGVLPGGMFWLSGDVLMCACPDCGAPMTVRIWLMIADCWRCQTSIELTEEQEREARRVLQRHAVRLDSPAAVTAPARRSPVPELSPLTRPATSRAGSVSRSGGDDHHPRVTHEPSAPPRAWVDAPTQRPRPQPARRRRANVTHWLHGLLKNMPAWLISLLFHVILLTILGLLTSEKERGPYITLSSRVNRVVREGGDTRIVDPTDKSVFDLGVPDSIDLEDPALRRAVARADQDARQLRLTEPNNPYLPDLETIKQKLQSRSASRKTLAVRDPRVRVEMVKREGGTTLTEAAVARGLRWLARHQNPDGSWSLDRFDRAASCDCGERGRIRSESAGTSLALLPFLGAGQTHLFGIYKDSVARGLRWLIQSQGSDGDLRGSSSQYPGMYAQGQAAIVLCEAFLMTGDEELRIPAQRAIDFIVEAQYPDGGWRYYPRKSCSHTAGRYKRPRLAVNGIAERPGCGPVGPAFHAGKRRTLFG